MSIRSRALSVVVLVAAALAAVVSAADARRLEFSEQHIRAVWSATQKLAFLNALYEIQCAVTLEGSFHSRTISKASGQLVGYISRAVLASCTPGETAGEAVILNGRLIVGDTLPWHIRFDSFSGPLPNISGIRVQIIKASFLLFRTMEINAQCLYSSTGERPLFMIFELNVAREVSGLRVDESRAIPLFQELGMFGTCPREVTLSEMATVAEQGTTTKVRVRLVT